MRFCFYASKPYFSYDAVNLVAKYSNTKSNIFNQPLRRTPVRQTSIDPDRLDLILMNPHQLPQTDNLALPQCVL